MRGEKKKKGANPNGENRGTVVGKLPNCEAISVACLSSIAIGFTKVKGNWGIENDYYIDLPCVSCNNNLQTCRNPRSTNNIDTNFMHKPYSEYCKTNNFTLTIKILRSSLQLTFRFTGTRVSNIY